MKQIAKFVAIVAMSAVVSMGVAYAVARTFEQFAAISLFGGILCALTMGAFDEHKRARYDSIKHKVGYRKAA